ncbi:sialate O-acetylesterase [Dinghuibacter silviterrae]|uniref:Sialate O-acetylesterase n=1 Tax=Dinghuibacter silviterrae TaxID=1539049 RepID=A0A4R8DHT2_9BACT|nr:sialate O-acetylesterase [Dinghuibacter silviterrae]TDW97281.1 sialate O-acetylesterase [Dinghuibacter silviterrae]
MKPIVVALLAILFFNPVTAQVTLPQLISDHMVLQRDVPLTLWGWSAPTDKVIVKIAGHTYKATHSGNSWQVRLPSMKAGGPYTLEIAGQVVRDVLVGDVWFCSGQSNMVLPMERVKEKYPDEVANADYPEIRNFFVPTAADVHGPARDLPAAHWVKGDTAGVLGFGAATWFFARQLYQKYHVPIGIINSSVGGTPIEAWISEQGYKDMPAYAERIARAKNAVVVAPGPGTRRILREPDQGLSGPVKWFDTSFTPEGWHPFWMPGYWADQGVKGLNGVVWFRKEIDVPESMAGKPAKLFVGRIVDADETYVNGVKVGNITYQYPPRRYNIPAGLLKSGKNLIVVRITNTSGKGGFVPDKRYELTDGTTHIDIRGDWTYKVGQVFPPRVSGGGFALPSAQNEPTGLYNTMVAPAVQYAIKGFVWYQGEANTFEPVEYKKLLPALIADWREKWQLSTLPFLYVQLPNFLEVQYWPSESQWAELREAELDALSVPNTAMAVTIDAGEWNDIHPLDKKDVGDRLALAAEHLAYGEKDLVYSGPIYQSAVVQTDSIVLSFTNTGSGLMAKGGGDLQQFAIAGADKKFIWADARILGDKVVVSSPDIPHPVYVRYAWANNPEGANLYNKEGLPASPFRTDEGL